MHSIKHTTVSCSRPWDWEYRSSSQGRKPTTTRKTVRRNPQPPTHRGTAHYADTSSNKEQCVRNPRQRGTGHQADCSRDGPRHERRDPPPPGERGRGQRPSEPDAAGTNPRSVITEWSRQQRDTNRIYCNGTDETSSSGGTTYTEETDHSDRQCNKYYRLHATEPS
jgi:hypothetical protein